MKVIKMFTCPASLIIYRLGKKQEQCITDFKMFTCPTSLIMYRLGKKQEQCITDFKMFICPASLIMYRLMEKTRTMHYRFQNVHLSYFTYNV